MLELLAYDRAPSAWRYTGHIVLRVSEPYPGKSLEHVRFSFCLLTGRSRYPWQSSNRTMFALMAV